MLTASTALGDTLVYDEDFEGVSPLSSWSILADTDTSASVASDPEGAGSPLGSPNNALFLDDNSVGGGGGKVELTLGGLETTYGSDPTETQFRFTYDMLTRTVGSFAGVEFNLYGSDTAGGSDERIVRIRNSANERIGVYDGASEVNYDAVYTKDVWHRVEFEFDMDTSTFDWSVTNLDTSNVVASNTDYDFETGDVNFVSSIRFSSFGSAQGEYYFDNLSLVAIPEPSTATLMVLFGLGFIGFTKLRSAKK